MAELRYWVWLASRRIFKADKLRELITYFGSPEQVYFARTAAYSELPWLSPAERESLADKRMTEVAAAMDLCAENDWRILTVQDSGYPERLRNIFDPPLVLYVRGRFLDIDSEAVVAAVGTRSCTPYGVKAAESIGYDMARAGCVVATGLARGIDSAAARGALRGGGRVIGVVGTGLDICYPAENRRLFDDVAAEGMIISEYMPGTAISRGAFPRRNRIMSGISMGVAVIEAPEKSGALITVNWALEQGRDVFAVPGNIDAEACRGSNRLLREGAEVVLSGWDIAEAYRARFPEKIRDAGAAERVPLDGTALEKLIEKERGDRVLPETDDKKVIDNGESVEYIDLVVSREDLSEDEYKVVSVMHAAEMQVDDLILQSGLSASRVLSALTVLEIKGLVTQQQGKRFTLKASVK